jgi:hypothetical protein
MRYTPLISGNSNLLRINTLRERKKRIDKKSKNIDKYKDK